MSTRLITIVKLQIPAGKANPGPPIGPAIGSHGLNIAEFCKQFNDSTKNLGGDVVPVKISVFHDRTFTFTVGTPPAAVLIIKELGLKSGSSVPHQDKVGKLTTEQLRKIAETKMSDLTASSIESAMRIIAGTARSMGVDVEMPEVKDGK